MYEFGDESREQQLASLRRRVREHLGQQKPRKRFTRQDRLDQGLCPTCAGTLEVGFKRCYKCLEADRTSDRKASPTRLHQVFESIALGHHTASDISAHTGISVGYVRLLLSRGVREKLLRRLSLGVYEVVKRAP